MDLFLTRNPQMDLGFIIQRFVSDCKSDIVCDIAILQKYLFSSGLLLLFYIFVGLFIMLLHLLDWNKPREQNKILPIIFIPSILGIASVIALHANEDSKMLFLLLDTIKESYVGWGLGLYLSLLYTYMDISATEQSETEFRRKVGGRVICNVFPVTLFQPRYVLLNQNNLKIHKYWTWQFVVIRLVCSVFMIILQLLDMYPVWLSWAFFSILNVSISLAYYTIVAFYQAFIKDFTADSDFRQFLYFRWIIFVCFGQGGVVKVIEAMGIMKTNRYWRQLPNDLVIAEMMFFTFLLPIAFTAPLDHSLLPSRRTKFAVPRPVLPEEYIVARAA